MSALNDYNKVQAYKAKHGGSLTDAMKKLKVPPGTYYGVQAKLKKKAKPKLKAKYKKMRGAESPTPSSNNVTVIMGTPDQIRAVLQ